MKSLTISLPKKQAKSLSFNFKIVLKKEALERISETATILFIFAGCFVWLFI